ncbi:uncharacterized protein LOC124916064 [Impatiens glandulifera]|uniref:uncharacterized protein LOC124916064 n=1 Tax=Impatiens glandulifera TaxID=253017 RepID=UPI001FB1828A|nr:uncharacterized protein LOC124916064 [Impatiens glandulifera]
MKSPLRSLISTFSGNFNPSIINLPTQNIPILWYLHGRWIGTAACSSETLQSPVVVSFPNDLGETLGSAEEAFRRWGCSESDISKLSSRIPSLRNYHLESLQPKLTLLNTLGLTASELINLVNYRPRFLHNHFHHGFQDRIEYLLRLFKTKEVLKKAILRNPSLLTYSFEGKVKPIISMYEEIGIVGNDLVRMLLSRPALISRTYLNEEKWDYIRNTGVSKESKMYKYIVTLVAISRMETILEKSANIEKFGFSKEEVFGLIRRSPLIMTISADKVQRNMTFICGTMKLSPRVILKMPPLLQLNLESILKPRFHLAKKIEEMGLVSKIEDAKLITSMRMKEKRFIEIFINCHPKDIAEELMELYTQKKCVKRLAESSKKKTPRLFPF